MTHRTPRRTALAATAAALLLFPIAACGDDEDEADATTTSETTTTEAAVEVAVDGAWARTSPAVATAGAVYAEITGGDADDTLVGVSVDPGVAARAEIHETVAAEGAMGGESEGAMGEETTTTMAGTGMMEMVPIDELPIPAGETVVLEPGGYHVMLLELAAPLEVGTTVEVTFTFASAGDVVVEAEVRDTAP